MAVESQWLALRFSREMARNHRDSPLIRHQAVYYDAAAANHMEALFFGGRNVGNVRCPGDRLVDFRQMLRGINIL